MTLAASGEPVVADVTSVRPEIRGKFLWFGDEKRYVKGVTYGAFEPDPDGNEYGDLGRVGDDLARMAASGFNAVRIPHTSPPVSLLDLAAQHGLHVMVGLSAEQFVGYLTDRRGAPDICRVFRERVRRIAGHPAILSYALGNEIPASSARWLGRRRVERYLEGLFEVVKEEDPGGLVTYVNYPSTEYLRLPFLDFLSFNVYLEQQERLAAYLPRLHNIAGDLPVLMSELGLDGLRNGEVTQANTLEWQIGTAFETGCIGAFVFSWTDEWYRAGEQVEDWEFGITRRDRSPKLALAAVERSFVGIPGGTDRIWPRISVIVCTHNGSRTLGESLEGLAHLDYPDYEVIVVDDGSSDGSGELARAFDVDVIVTEHGGLSAARNLGLRKATGDIVAYLDDDASPDPHWLTYLAIAFSSGLHAGVGGPNLSPPDDGWIARSVACSPGNPTHVLLTDTVAEHIPGCNMAFRKEVLEEIGGFDPQFRIAGDDVDVCWRLQEAGFTLGFHPAAVVWHRRRNSLRAYWRQQKNYGQAEAMLERKWPEKYNAAGHVAWTGRVYQNTLARTTSRRLGRVHHGPLGNAPFQSLYERAPSHLSSLPLTPDWYLGMVVLACLSALGVLWSPLFIVAAPLLILTVLVLFGRAILCASQAQIASESERRSSRLVQRALIAALHVAQPLARLIGRLRDGLAPWRQPTSSFRAMPWPRMASIWSEDAQSAEGRVKAIESAMRFMGVAFARGGAFDRWDISARGGALGSARLRMAVEDHGAGRQLVRIRIWPRSSPAGLAVAFALIALGGFAEFADHWAAATLASLGVLVGIGSLVQAGRAVETLLKATHHQAEVPPALDAVLLTKLKATKSAVLAPESID